MPAPAPLTYIESQAANAHAQTQAAPTTSPYDILPAGNYRNASVSRAFNVLLNYNPQGSGAIPDYDFVIPGGASAGRKISYKSSSGEFQLDGIGYSSIASNDKKLVYFWLPNVLQAGFNFYDFTYNI